MDKDILNKIKNYSAIKHNIAVIEFILTICLLLTIQLSDFSYTLYQLFSWRFGNYYIVLALYCIVLGVMISIVTFGLDYLGTYKVEQSFALTKQNFLSWFSDYIKRSLIGGVFFIVIICMVSAFMHVSKSFWWIFAGLVYFVINIIFARIFPLVIIPLFYKLSKMQEGSLKERLKALAGKSGVKVLDIYNIALGEKTTKANAAVCGLGSTKRILLSDTMLDSYTEDEIEATLAHELSHHAHKHFWKIMVFNFIFTVTGFYVISIFLNKASDTGLIRHIYDISIFPLLALIYIVFCTAVLPLENIISRHYESEADRDAITFSNNPRVFAGLMEKLTLQNFSDPVPGLLTKLFFYDHPPSGERIAYAVQAEQKKI